MNLVLRLEELENEKNELKNNNIKEKISLMFELIENLSESYNRANSEWKNRYPQKFKCSNFL